MSIFQAREWWSSEPEEEDDSGNEIRSPCVCLCSFPSALGHAASVVLVSSLSPGTLRLLLPFRDEANTGQGAMHSRTYDPGNLLMEVRMDVPVLQVAVGRLSPAGGSDPKIAVLHPRRLSVYSLQVQRGKNRESDSFSLGLQYQFSLSRSAHSLVVGPFGGGGGAKKDYLCVQSLDGTLNLFEQDTFAFSRFLPDFLLPGPIVYAPRTDSFVVASSSHRIESYRYQALAAAGDASEQRPKNDSVVSGKRVTADWILGLGEEVARLQVVAAGERDRPDTLVAAGARTICAMYDTGVVVFMKKLDFAPLCSLSYRPYGGYGDGKVMTLAASDSQTLMVYEGTALKWAAQLPFNPVFIGRGTFRRGFSDNDDLLQDMLVLASPLGQVFIAYLGTDPAVFTVPAPITREVNYEDTDLEFAQLQEAIRDSQAKGEGAAPTTSSELTVSCRVSNQFQRSYFEGEFNNNSDNNDEDSSWVPTTVLTVMLSCNAPLSKVRVAVDVDRPIVATHATHVVNSLTDSASVDTNVYLASRCVPHSLEARINVVYLSSQGVPNVHHQTVSLPLKLILKPCPPIKDADFKVTLSTNKPAVSLLDLFPEFALDAGMANAAGFRYHCGPVVTVLSSKTSQRYRLQSDNLPSLWILTREIEIRLRKAHAQSQPPLQCGYSSSLPMHEYFLEVETRFRRRQRLGALRAQLARCAAQFRAIERRLLSRFKDRTPSALTNLDTLLEGTYRQISAAADAAEECRAELESSSCNLSCITGLLLLLSRLSTGASEADAAMLASALSPIVQEGAAGLGEDGAGGHGWEETTDAALTFLLRTSLAKAGRENQGATPITLDAPKDTVRLKKHVSSVMDRVAKGGKISDGRNAVAATALLDFNPVDNDDDVNDEVGGNGDQLPAGSKFGEAGERLRSARARSARIGVTAQPASTAATTAGADDYADVEGDIREEEGGEEEDDNDDVDETKDADELIGW